MKYSNLLPFLFLISSCSTFSIDEEISLEDTVLNVFSDNYQEVNLTPEDAIKFQCANNEFFYLRYLEENNAVWIILKNREFRLDKMEGSNKTYGNDTSTLNINGREAIIKIDSEILYKECQNIYKEEISDDNSNTKPEGAKEINEGDASNNTDIILNDDPDLIQDNEQSDAPKSSWLEKLKFWKE